MVAKYLSLLLLLLTGIVHATPNIEHWQTKDGARVYFVAAPELPMIDVNIVFDAGSARDGDLSGVALLTNAMLNEGADGLNTDQIATQFEDVGAQFGNSSKRDMTLFSLRTLTTPSALEPALSLFNKVLTQPDFPQASFDRIKKQILLSLQAEKQSPAALASRAFYTHLFGDHPYATMPIGDQQSVDKIDIASLKTFYQQYYVANNAVIILVGAVTTAQAKVIAEQVLTGLKPGHKAANLPKVTALTTANMVKIKHPSSQTHILMGQTGLSRNDADYFALYVGNHILGGSGLVSQLNNEIREKRGLSYSVYSYFHPMHQQGPYQFGLQTRNDQAQQALDIMRATTENFIANGPTEDELIAAKKNITGGFALRVDSNSKIAGYLMMIGFYGLPLDYLDTFKSSVNAITTTHIKQAYQRRIHPDKMVTIMVGGE